MMYSRVCVFVYIELRLYGIQARPIVLELDGG